MIDKLICCKICIHGDSKTDKTISRRFVSRDMIYKLICCKIYIWFKSYRTTLRRFVSGHMTDKLICYKSCVQGDSKTIGNLKDVCMLGYDRKVNFMYKGLYIL